MKKLRAEVIDEILKYFQDNDTEATDAILELDSWNGYLGDRRYYPMDELDELYCNEKPSEVLCRAFYGYDEDTWATDEHGEKHYGAFNPNRDYFGFNGYGNLVSTDYEDYSDYIDEYFVEELDNERNHLTLSDELDEMLDELDESADTLEELIEELEDELDEKIQEHADAVDETKYSNDIDLHDGVELANELLCQIADLRREIYKRKAEYAELKKGGE